MRRFIQPNELNMLKFPRLQRSFFNRHPVEAAQDLLGKMMVFKNFEGIVIETEAYRGIDDEACHAFKGLTPRTKVMFGPPGHAYVYMIYGIHHCLNIITEPEGCPGGILIRGMQLIKPMHLVLNGPGKLCKHLNINRTYNGVDVITDDQFYFLDTPNLNKIFTSKRIGITKNAEVLWRFYINP